MMKKIFSLCIIVVVFFSFSSAFAAKGEDQGPKKNQEISGKKNFGQEKKGASDSSKQKDGSHAIGGVLTGSIVSKEYQQYQKVQELKKTIDQIIPLAQKAGYPINSLKKHQQQLSRYRKYDIQKLSVSIKQEIAKIRVFIANKRSIENINKNLK